MGFQKGDIIDVFFDLPYSKETKTHPAIIISNEDVYDNDELYICVMITSSKETDLFSFHVTQDMLIQKNNKEFSQARCHLISYVLEKHIVGKIPKNTLKENALKHLLIKINDTVF